MKRESAGQIPNINVHAVNDGSNPGFNIFLDFSGQKEFLMHHRHNGLLYRLLKDGVRLQELRRLEQRRSFVRRHKRRQNRRLENLLQYLLKEADSCISKKLTCFEPSKAGKDNIAKRIQKSGGRHMYEYSGAEQSALLMRNEQAESCLLNSPEYVIFNE